MAISQYVTPSFRKATLWKLCFRWGAHQVSHSSVTGYHLALKLAASLHVNFKGNVSRFISGESLKYVHTYPEQYDLLNIAIYTEITRSAKYSTPLWKVPSVVAIVE